MAKGRSTHLTPEEIAAALLDLFDVSAGQPTVRSLAAALSVSPKAIYHYYENRADIVQAAVDLVWEEAIADIFGQVADPITAPGDPADLLVVAAVAARRAFGRHYRLAPYLGAAPEATERLAGALTVLGSLFEQLGISGPQVTVALYAYATYTLGSILLEANRRIADEVDNGRELAAHFATSDRRPPDSPTIDPTTAAALDLAIINSRSDRQADEDLFEAGLRALLGALATA